MRFKRELDLQTMCLNVIVDNIQLFSMPIKSIELYIEFLRRCYSDRLFYLIERKCLVPEKYIEWLLTPYWKNVSLTGSGYSVSRVIKKLQSIGNAINSLNLENTSSSADILSAIICCVPNITYLNLRWTYCTDAVLTLIRKMCTSLTSLDLSNCRCVTDMGMTYLCNLNKKDLGFDSLKVLNLYKTSVTSKGIVLILKYLTSLQLLSYEGICIILYNLHKQNFKNNSTRYSLTNFEYRHSPISLSQVLEVWTVMCPDVTKVRIQDKISESDLQLCSKFQYLKKMKIVSINYYPKETVISPFIKLKGSLLTELEIMHATVSIEIITRLCYNLERIYLFNLTYEDFVLPASNSELHKLNNLKSMTVKHINFQRDFAFKSIQLLINSSKNLNELCIQYAEHFTENLTDIILSVPLLRKVDFSFTDIKPPTLLRFFTCEKVTKIHSDGCPCISERDKESTIMKLINDSQYGNTCSWEIDYSEIEKESFWDYSIWSGEISI